MVAPVVRLGQLALTVGGAAKFAAPDDQRLVEHAPLLEVGDQCGAGLVDVFALRLVFLGQAAVRVPAAMENLDVAHAALGQSAGVEAAGGKGAGAFGCFTVQFKRRITLACQIHQFWDGGLHAVGQFVLLDARQNLWVGELLVMRLVDRGQRIELGAAIPAGDACRVFQVQHRVALAPQQHALMLGRHEAGSPKPVEQALLGELGASVHDNVARQVLVHATQPVAEPGPEAGPAGNLAPGLDERDRRVVVDRLGKGAVHDAKFLRHLGSVRQQLTDPHALVVVFVPRVFVFARADRQRFLSGRHACDALAIADVLGQILPEHLAHLRLVTPEIVMARPAAHKKINHPLGLGRKVRAARLASGVGKQIRANDVC